VGGFTFADVADRGEPAGKNRGAKNVNRAKKQGGGFFFQLDGMMTTGNCKRNIGKKESEQTR